MTRRANCSDNVTARGPVELPHASRPSHPPQGEVTKSPMTSYMASEPSFRCTFCWKYQFRPARPRALGRGARIACEVCWESVLDLSICWVCGEIVVRGEEVVSLGWCFWHRACFGCLICGTGLDPPENDEGEREDGGSNRIDGDEFGGGEGADSGCIDAVDRRRRQRRLGVELESIRLCSWCQTATDGLYSGQILELGLKNVTKKDGGLSRSRLDLLQKTRSKDEAGSNLLGASDLGVGIPDRSSNCSDPAECVSSMPAPIYTSVLDAVGEPTFRASKTKPLPSWMILQTKNRRSNFEPKTNSTSFPEVLTPPYSPPFTIAEEPQDSHTLVETAVTVPGPHAHKDVTRFGDSAHYATAASNIEQPTVFGPAIAKDAKFRESVLDTPWDIRAPRPQRSDSPYPSRRAIYPPPLVLNIPVSPFALPVVMTAVPARKISAKEPDHATVSSQIATALRETSAKLKKREVLREEEPKVERSKRQKREGAVSAGKGDSKGIEDADQEIDRYVDRKDELRRELLVLFAARKAQSQEQWVRTS